VEWGRAGEPPLTYAVEGWARQRDVSGELVTVFELALNYRGTSKPPRAASSAYNAVPLAVRVVVNEASGDATLTSRR
jgi:hypothetical protein